MRTWIFGSREEEARAFSVAHSHAAMKVAASAPEEHRMTARTGMAGHRRPAGRPLFSVFLGLQDRRELPIFSDCVPRSLANTLPNHENEGFEPSRPHRKEAGASNAGSGGADAAPR